MIEINKLRINVFGSYININSLMIPVLIILYFIGGLIPYFAVMVCAIIHELGHIAVAIMFKFKIDSIEILPVGITAKIDMSADRKLYRELMLFIAGPTVNLFIALAASLLAFENQFITHEVKADFIIINLGLGILNLLPILPLDGGRILNSILSFRYSCYKSYKICYMLSKSLAIFILIISVYAVIHSKNLSYMLTAMFLLGYISKNMYLLKSHALIEVVEKRQVLKSSNMMSVKIIAVNGDTKLMDLIKEFALGFHYLILVLDEDMKIISEVEIIEAVIANGAESICGDIKKGD